MENRGYDFYLVDRLKEIADSLRSAPDQEKLLLQNLFDENMESLVQYHNLNTVV